ncbi:XRE family transcriptional regulator [Campylobacter ureolyticus]|uniref:XRE family transcriptional regulator n=1 Tax=Campylobacter ureolyticus TaxID=827 RepID=UPI0022B2DF30|nr:XRE family transcriptional regulator [Campylobacter ureolyticus]MCZ6174684.1 XRE family transcriptional regulator [Campylobacter ureolyticus]
MIGEKIRAIREENDYTQKDFAKKFNIAYGTLQSYEYGETEPKLKFLEGLSKYFKIPMSYFYSDVANISSITQKSVANMSPIDENSSVAPQNLKMSQDNISIPFFENVYASAGGGYINDENSPKSLEFSKSFIRDYLGTTEFSSLHIIKSKGDSMQPSIPKNALLFVRLGQVKEGHICVVRVEDELYVKRLQKRPVIKLLSDNPDYDPITLHEDEDFELIGTVLGYIKRF